MHHVHVEVGKNIRSVVASKYDSAIHLSVQNWRKHHGRNFDNYSYVLDLLLCNRSILITDLSKNANP